MKTTVIFHAADFDGLMCRETAKYFLPTAESIGWDFGDKPLAIPPEGVVYVLDLPVDRVFGFDFAKPETVIEKFVDVHAMKAFNKRLTWIDHHASSIASHPTDIPGYRIDGVAACRLAWQWFAADKANPYWERPGKEMFVERRVNEPYVIRLCGEHDIWDHRDPNALPLQEGLRQLTEDEFKELIAVEFLPPFDGLTSEMMECLEIGQRALQARKVANAGAMKRSFLVEWEGLKFLALNAQGGGSQTFESRDYPESGHDALLAFYFNGKAWTVSLYHAKHRTDLDLSKIAVKHGGGGHAGACGFVQRTLPFEL